MKKMEKAGLKESRIVGNYLLEGVYLHILNYHNNYTVFIYHYYYYNLSLFFLQ